MRYLFLALLVLFALPAYAAEHTVEDATVNLYCVLEAGNKVMSTTGSGVFISDRGIILTNAHVAQFFLVADEDGSVQGECRVRTGSPAEATYTAELLYLPPQWLEESAPELKKRSPKGTGENDFALLYVTDADGPLPFLPSASTTPQEGDEITIAGYPTDGRDFNEIRRELERVTDDSTITNVQGFLKGQSDLLTIAPSDAGGTGVSGGPITNTTDALVAIAANKSTAKGDRTIRAISLPYIDRTIRTQTGMALSAILASDLALRATITKIMIPESAIERIEKALRTRR